MSTTPWTERSWWVDGQEVIYRIQPTEFVLTKQVLGCRVVTTLGTGETLAELRALATEDAKKGL